MSETLLGLVSQYSPSGQERGAVEWLTAHMRTLGYEQSFVDEAGNAVGVMGGGPRQVILLGHIDTVPGEIPVALTPSPSPAGRGEILYGRGAVDAKGPLACFVDAVAQVGAVAGWQFVVIGAVEEERDSQGARFVANQYRPDFLIVGEPNRWDRIALGYKGAAWAEIRVRRAQNHTASGEETAAEAAVEIWVAIRKMTEEFNTGKKRVFDQILPTLREIEAREEAFSQWARLKVGARLPLELPPEAWYARLRETFPEAEIAPVGYAIPAWACEKNSPLVRALLSGIRAEGGVPAFVYKSGSADLNIVAPLWQCPALVYGPGDSALDHTPDEHIAISEYTKAVNVLTKSLKTLTEK
ncbi:MAG: [LysW]-lysine hydrolase [Anaerolineales bacterium]